MSCLENANAVVLIVLGLQLGAAGPGAGQPVRIKFTLDWKIQGLHAWFYWAKAKGYFAAENLDVTIET
jgi:NitT/TauT family transport system substrate-binding protein